MIPKTLHWCIQLLLSVPMWMSDTHPGSTGAKLLLQLHSPSCLLGLSQLKSEQLTATHPFSCSPHPYNLRVTHDTLLFLLTSPLSLAPSTSSSSPLHPLSTSAIDFCPQNISRIHCILTTCVPDPVPHQSVPWVKQRASTLLFLLLPWPPTVRSHHSSQSSSFKYRSPVVSVVSSKSQSAYHSP